MKFASCEQINNLYINFNGRIDTEEKVVALCCEGLRDIPGIPFTGTPEEILQRFIGLRTMIVSESQKNAQHKTEQHICTAGCAGCANYRVAEHTVGLFSNYVNLSMYPSPCQCRCIYCGVPKQWRDAPEIHEAYQKLFAVLDLGLKTGVIQQDAIWQVSCGEITIHPYRERILDLVRGRRAVFYTNCFLYDNDIGQILHENPRSAINLSIDAGIAQTWKTVKGVDNFDTITENLVKYRQNSLHSGQITLKYIILPDINDTYEDYISLIEIMKVLEVKHLSLSRDVRTKYQPGTQEKDKLLGAAAYLAALCHKNGITNDMFTFTPGERHQIVQLAAEVLQKNLI